MEEWAVSTIKILKNWPIKIKMHINNKRLVTYWAHSASLPRFWLSNIARINLLFSSRYCITHQKKKSITHWRYNNSHICWARMIYTEKADKTHCRQHSASSLSLSRSWFSRKMVTETLKKQSDRSRPSYTLKLGIKPYFQKNTQLDNLSQLLWKTKQKCEMCETKRRG